MDSWLTAQFEAHRHPLRAVAYRMLGSLHEAEDAVQEAWLRLQRVDATTVENLGGWLTTVVSRVCLDMLRARRSRKEEPSAPQGVSAADPEGEVVLADSVGVALLVVLDTLSPAERLAFVLHDLFGMPFEEIGPIVGKSTDAAKQLASRARRRVRGSEAPSGEGRARQREVVEAFLKAVRTGDLQALLAVLDPGAVLRIDAGIRIDAPPEEAGMPREVRGATKWAKQLIAMAGALHSVQAALVDGAIGLVFAPRGKLSRVVTFTVTDGRVTRVEVLGDPARLRDLDVAVLSE